MTGPLMDGPNGQVLAPQQATGGSTAPQRVGKGGTGDNGVTSRNFGNFWTDDIASLLQAAAGDPERAYQLLRLALGQKGRGHGFMSPLRESLYGKAFQIALSLAGPGMPGYSAEGLQSAADSFLTNGVQANDLLGYT